MPTGTTPIENADVDVAARTPIADFYKRVRSRTESLCTPLETEDFVVQPHPDVSPPKWHLGHTTWFFETMLLRPHARGYTRFHPSFDFIFNSYYESLGPRVSRAHRGALSRPTVREVRVYRRSVDAAMDELIHQAPPDIWPAVRDLIVLGLNHEEQHQELLLTDIKAIFAATPLLPAYLQSPPVAAPRVEAAGGFVDFAGGLTEIGASAEGFSWDNERPRHSEAVPPVRLGRRLVTNADYLAFMEAGGYRDARWWLSDGWDAVRREEWEAPLYWLRDGAAWRVFTLSGLRSFEPSEPVCHVSFFEADAYARWAGARLPTEAEWEAASAAGNLAAAGNFLEEGRLHPAPAVGDTRLLQTAGDVWEWTLSAYLPYPGYLRPDGPLGEYNAKFMVNQMTLRGGSCATPRAHYRATYRNFFQPDKRWQFTGIRLARNGGAS